jgi:hypothetical protein
MKTEKTRKTRKSETWKSATAKGALVWGSIYSTATSGAAYLLAPVVTGSTPAFSDIFVNSLVIFPTAGAARGLVMWRMKKDRLKSRRHPLTVHRKKTA